MWRVLNALVVDVFGSHSHYIQSLSGSLKSLLFCNSGFPLLYCEQCVPFEWLSAGMQCFAPILSGVFRFKRYLLMAK